MPWGSFGTTWGSQVTPGSVLGAILAPKGIPNGSLGVRKTLPKYIKIVANFYIAFSSSAKLLQGFTQGVGALGELLINNMFVATSWDGF